MKFCKTEAKWKAYPGDERYLLSKEGEVLSTILEVRLKPYEDAAGYRHVVIGGKRRKIHQLVLETFVGPRPEGFITRHLDGNPKNNNVENLAWGTHQENHEDSVRHGTAFFFSVENHCRSHTVFQQHLLVCQKRWQKDHGLLGNR